MEKGTKTSHERASEGDSVFAILQRFDEHGPGSVRKIPRAPGLLPLTQAFPTVEKPLRHRLDL